MADTDSCASLEMAAHAPTMRLELKEQSEKTDAKELEEKAGEKRCVWSIYRMCVCFCLKLRLKMIISIKTRCTRGDASSFFLYLQNVFVHVCTKQNLS